MPRILCKACSTEHNATLTVCPRCGFDRNARVEGFAPSIVIEGPDPESGDHVLRVDDPSGVRSVARRLADGRLGLDAAGAAGIGRAGEGRAADTFKDFLVREGHKATIHDGDDPAGVDRVLELDGHPYVLQFTLTVQATDFWREASASSANTQVERPHAAAWLRQALEHKRDAAKAQHLPTVLVVDARHAGIVAHTDLVGAYLFLHGEPVDGFGFASVWLVGPTADHVCRIGRGYP